MSRVSLAAGWCKGPLGGQMSVEKYATTKTGGQTTSRHDMFFCGQACGATSCMLASSTAANPGTASLDQIRDHAMVCRLKQTSWAEKQKVGSHALLSQVVVLSAGKALLTSAPACPSRIEAHCFTRS